MVRYGIFVFVVCGLDGVFGWFVIVVCLVKSFFEDWFMDFGGFKFWWKE